MTPRTNGAFAWVQTAAGHALVCRALEPYAAHLFTTRHWALGVNASPDGERGWPEVASALNVDPADVLRVHQVHGTGVFAARPIERGDAGRAETTSEVPKPARLAKLRDADIIVSSDPARAIAIQTADCVPILVADRRTGAVAAAHAGWRGLGADVPRATIAALGRELGSRASDLVVAIGPAIGRDRYEVGAEVRECFERSFEPGLVAEWFSPAVRPNHWLFHAARVAVDLLEASGVPRGQIHDAELCTSTHAQWFCSYRRDGAGAGRMAAAIRASRGAMADGSMADG